MLNFFENYRSIDIPERLQNDLLDSTRRPIKKIEKLNRINIFVGQNNSGKSLLIREILKSESDKFIGDNIWHLIQEQVSFLNDVQTKLDDAFTADNVKAFRSTQYGVIFDLDDIKSHYKNFTDYKANYEVNHIIQYLTNFFNRDFIKNTNLTYEFIDRNTNIPTHLNSHSNIVDKIFQTLEELKKESKDVVAKLTLLLPNPISYETKKFYIPSVRTLRNYAQNFKIDEDTKKEYKFEANIQLINGQDFPMEVFDSKNDEYIRKKRIINFENFLSKEFFDSQSIDFTYNNRNKTLLMKIGEERERPIFELGDGLQMIIILTYPFFFNSGGIIAIEEPELFIHPGLQKSFIKFLTSNPLAKNFQIFIATHSNHILDSINDSNAVSIFTTKKALSNEKPGDEKDAKFILENVANGDENLLNLLGVTSTSVYLSNCTIWVEGITDKIYFQKFINVYLRQDKIAEKYEICKHFKEGNNYSFALTGGDSIDHWDFGDDSEYAEISRKIIVRKFCSKSMVIVDEDFGKNLERKERLSNLLDERFIVLQLPEIENYLSVSVVKKTACLYSSVQKVINDISDINITEKDMTENKIGKLLDREIKSKHPKVKSFAVSNENGSLKPSDKFEFCQKSLPLITAEELTEASKNIVEKILDFIIEKNL